MHRSDLFACPFFFNRIALNDNLVATAIEETKCVKAMSMDTNLLENTFSFLYNTVYDISAQVMSEMGYKNFKIFSSWMTYTAKKYRHAFDHMHCNSFYSGVLYLTENPSPLLFRHPLPWRWDSGKKDDCTGILSSNKFGFLPAKGDIILFPSHVHHVIMSHDNEDPRISLAFNIVPIGQYGNFDSKINVTVDT